MAVRAGATSGIMRLRTGIGLALLCALFATALLACMPGLHERIHSRSAHECAINLFAGGTCEQTPSPTTLGAVRLSPSPQKVIVRPPLNLGAGTRFSVLEHGPPALA